jgi:hypothetical protein
MTDRIRKPKFKGGESAKQAARDFLAGYPEDASSNSAASGTPWRVNRADADFESGVRNVVMPCCAFSFEEHHVDGDGDTYTCPQCAPPPFGAGRTIPNSAAVSQDGDIDVAGGRQATRNSAPVDAILANGHEYRLHAENTDHGDVRVWVERDSIVAWERTEGMTHATRNHVEELARWLWDHDSEGAFTWESTADEWREQARELLTFLESNP